MATEEASRVAATRATEGDGGAAIHPAFLRIGPWALSVVVAMLFAMSFATSYAALRDYAYELQFSRTFAMAFPLVLDAVIVVLAVTLLLERALGTRRLTLAGRPIGARPPTWPLLAFWLYFAASVAGNVGHAPNLLAARIVAAVPPVSAALTFHLLLRLLDRAVLLRQIAEEYEQRTFDEQSRQAARKARRDALVAGPGATEEMGALMRALRPLGLRKAGATGYPALSGRRQSNGHARDDPLMTKVRAAEIAGQRVTGETVAEWLGVSPRTGRRRLAQLGNEADE